MPPNVSSHPDRLRPTLITLSELQAAEHNWNPETSLQATAYEHKGDGTIDNDWRNRQLAVCALLMVADTNIRGKYSYHIITLPNLLSRMGIVAKLNALEIEQIVGWNDESGQHHFGDLEDNITARNELAAWPIGEAREVVVESTYQDMADDRSGARNDPRVKAAAHARRLSSVEDSRGVKNPRAKMASTVALERVLVERLVQLDEIGAKGLQRAQRISRWIINDMLITGKAKAHLEGIMQTQQLDDVYNLQPLVRGLGDVPGLRFITVAAFNQLRYTMNQTHGRLESTDPIQHTLDGLDFHGQQNYLVTPFRKVGEASGKYTSGDQAEQTLQQITERIAALSSIPRGGPYGKLAERILPFAQTTAQLLRTGDRQGMRDAAKSAKYLINHLCLPDDPDSVKKVWFYDQL